MTLFGRRSELDSLVSLAIRQSVDRLSSQHKRKDVYSFVIFPSSGYRDIGISYATRSELSKRPKGSADPDPRLLEKLKNHPDLMRKVIANKRPEFYFEVTSCEWAGVRACADLFGQLNRLISEGYDELYDAGIENTEICSFFESLLTAAILSAKSSGVFQKDAFADDVLLGVQFPDSGNADAVVRVSDAVNSRDWHSKVCSVYGNYATP